jgi:flagellar motility protein MotE (MotC chaperone)
MQPCKKGRAMLRATCFALCLCGATVAVADDVARERLIEQGRADRDKQIASQEYQMACEEAKQDAIKKAKPKKGASGTLDVQQRGQGEVPIYTFYCAKAAQKEEELKKVRTRMKEIEARIEQLKSVEWITPKVRCNELQVGQVGVITFDGSNPVIEWSSTHHWVKMPTAGMADGKRYAMDRVMHVAGTKQYTTILGARRTLLEIHAVE